MFRVKITKIGWKLSTVSCNTDAQVGDSTVSKTEAVSAHVGRFLGFGPCITIIGIIYTPLKCQSYVFFYFADTPGTLDSEGRDFKHAVNLVDAMRDRIQSVDLILLLFNGQKARFQQATISSLQLLEGIFSSSLWENTVRLGIL